MKYIKQRHARGCGAACLAMVAGINYNRAVRLIQPLRQKGEPFNGTALEDLLRSLNILETSYRIYFGQKLHNIRNNAYIALTLPCGCRHAVAWDTENKRILDPDPLGPDDEDHLGGQFRLTKRYIEKNLNYIVEIIPS